MSRNSRREHVRPHPSYSESTPRALSLTDAADATRRRAVASLSPLSGESLQRLQFCKFKNERADSNLREAACVLENRRLDSGGGDSVCPPLPPAARLWSRGLRPRLGLSCVSGFPGARPTPSEGQFQTLFPFFPFLPDGGKFREFRGGTVGGVTQFVTTFLFLGSQQLYWYSMPPSHSRLGSGRLRAR